MTRSLYFGLVGAVALACAQPRQQADTEGRPDRNVITLAQLQAAREDNAYELVRRLHPMWLQKRGSNSMQYDGDIVVYMNETRLGGPEALRTLETINITSIRYYDPGAANYRFGSGHQHGVIQVSTKVPVVRSPE